MKQPRTISTVERLWSIEDVAAFLGVPKATLYQWRYNGYGPTSVRIGRYVRYDSDVVRQWVKEQEVAA